MDGEEYREGGEGGEGVGRAGMENGEDEGGMVGGHDAEAEAEGKDTFPGSLSTMPEMPAMHSPLQKVLSASEQQEEEVAEDALMSHLLAISMTRSHSTDSPGVLGGGRSASASVERSPLFNLSDLPPVAFANTLSPGSRYANMDGDTEGTEGGGSPPSPTFKRL